MNSLDKSKFGAMFTKLWLAFQNYSEPEGKGLVYFSELKRFDARAVESVFSTLWRTGEKFPNLPEMIKLCSERHNSMFPPPEPEDTRTDREKEVGEIMWAYLGRRITGDKAYSLIKQSFKENNEQYVGKFDWLKGQGIWSPLKSIDEVIEQESGGK